MDKADVDRMGDAGDPLAALRTYYAEIFPAEEMFRVFNIGSSREISFYSQQSAYIRYLSFDDAGSLRQKLVQMLPKKVDIGAVFSQRPSKAPGPFPVYRELVFDIDLTDYPRSCCEGKRVCGQCYEKIKCAVRLLDYSLREELGFRNIGFVFSGRRGVHCWVLDDADFNSTVRNDVYKFYQAVLQRQQLSIPAYREIIEQCAGRQDASLDEWFIHIDKSVLTATNHLVKVPFSVHPETGCISVPLDPGRIAELDEIPRLVDVVEQPGLLDGPLEIFRRWRD